jgi:nicotinamide-nucleotide amidase
MKIEVLTIGNELLDGRRVDSNMVWLGQALSNIGLEVSHRQTMLDDRDAIADAFALAMRRADVVLSTGGLGPTQDDVTFEALAQALSCPLTFHESIMAEIQAKYAKRGLPCPESNRRQALLPSLGQAIANGLGTAPGCFVSHEDAQIFCFPGVPVEMQAMMENFVLPKLQAQLGTSKEVHTWSYAFFGQAEALVEETMQKHILSQDWAKDVEVSYTASFPLVTVVFRVRDLDVQTRQALQAKVDDQVITQASPYLWKMNQKSIEHRVLDALQSKNQTLQVAESLTGGMVATKLVDVPGASKVFTQGLVTYHNQSKQRLLDVSEETLATHGAVSRQCALEMARGLHIKHGADWGVSTTGIAGPTGATPNKPIGLTYIAWVGHNYEDACEYHLGDDRMKNRVRASFLALQGLHTRLLEKGETSWK